MGMGRSEKKTENNQPINWKEGILKAKKEKHIKEESIDPLLNDAIGLNMMRVITYGLWQWPPWTSPTAGSAEHWE